MNFKKKDQRTLDIMRFLLVFAYMKASPPVP